MTREEITIARQATRKEYERIFARLYSLVMAGEGNSEEARALRIRERVLERKSRILLSLLGYPSWSIAPQKKAA